VSSEAHEDDRIGLAEHHRHAESSGSDSEILVLRIMSSRRSASIAYRGRWTSVAPMMIQGERSGAPPVEIRQCRLIIWIAASPRGRV
jgi:hypothetical protein